MKRYRILEAYPQALVYKTIIVEAPDDVEPQNVKEDPHSFNVISTNDEIDYGDEAYTEEFEEII